MSECKFNPHDLFFQGCGNPKDSYMPKETKYKLEENGDVFDEYNNFIGKGSMVGKTLIVNHVHREPTELEHIIPR